MLWIGLGSAVVVAALAYIALRSRQTNAADGLQLTGLLHININCSDFERSRKFYERLGFKVIMKVEPKGSPEVAAAVGLKPYTLRGALLAHKDGSVIDLLEWQDPRDDRPPYDQLNHLGLARIALTTNDIESDIRSLKSEGVEFVSESPAGVRDPFGGTTQFICFKDPDGTVLELVQMGTVMGVVQRATKRKKAPVAMETSQ